MLNKIFKTKFHLRFTFNPYLRFLSDKLGNQLCINHLKRNTQIIVSLTSYNERFKDLELALFSIMKQSILPDRIILWLSDKYKSTNDLPYSITKYIKNGLEIRFVEDIGSYTKIIYALKEFPDSIIVTADDDVIYPKDWLKKLYNSYITSPDDIHLHRAHKILIKNHSILPYEQWTKHTQDENASFNNFITGVGGVLYPPKCFLPEVFRKDIFLTKAPSADDIWLWTIALLSGRKIRVVQNHIQTITCTDVLGQLNIKRKTKLYNLNKNGQNDTQLNAILKIYGNNILKKLK